MTGRTSTLVGVFDERAQAEQAIEQLHNAGIPDNQITYSGSGAGAGSGFAASIKSFFTGEDTSTNANSLCDYDSAFSGNRLNCHLYSPINLSEHGSKNFHM